MALDDSDKTWIREEVRRIEDHLGTKIALASKDITSHMSDRFAHGWDHSLIERSQATVQEWNAWRDNINRWRWMMTGALVITSVEIPIVATIAVAFVHH